MRRPARVAIAFGSAAAILAAQANPFSTAVRYSAQIVFAGVPAGEAPLDVEDVRVDDAALSSRGAGLSRITITGRSAPVAAPLSPLSSKPQ